MPTILLINDTSDQENWGCQATSTALKEMLRNAFPNLRLLTIPLGDLRKEFNVYKLPSKLK